MCGNSTCQLLGASGMAITQKCGQCGCIIEMPDEYAGEQVECQICHHIAHLPGRDILVSLGLSRAAMICGIVGCLTCLVPVMGVVGVVLGIVALSRIKRDPLRYRGRPMAVIGIITGAVSLSLFVSCFPYFRGFFAQRGNPSSRLVCASNLKGLKEACRSYAIDNGGIFPNDMQTLLKAAGIYPGALICPTDDEYIGDGCIGVGSGSYIYIPGQSIKCDPQNVLVYEKEGNHHGEGGNVLFLEGYVSFVKPYSEVKKLVEKTKWRLSERGVERVNEKSK